MKRPESRAAPLILLLGILAFNTAVKFSRRPDPQPVHEKERVFVQIVGKLKYPGTFAFPGNPSLKEIAGKAALKDRISNEREFFGIRFQSGDRLIAKQQGNSVRVETDQMTAFNKLTLGIPISLNMESTEGLTALPGIGLGLAKAIVEKRKKTEGFNTVEELLSVPGVSQRLFRKIHRHIKL